MESSSEKATNYQTIVSDCTGLYKVIRNGTQISKFGAQDKNRSMHHICYAGNSPNREFTLCGAFSNTLEFWNTVSLSKSNVLNDSVSMLFSLQLPENTSPIVGLYAYQSINRVLITYGRIVSVSPKVKCIASTDDHFITAGERVPILYTADGKEKWRGKGLPNDSLGFHSHSLLITDRLAIPQHDTNIQFIDSSKFITVSYFSKVNFYDTIAQRRPVHTYSIQNADSPLYSIATSTNNVYTGDGKGRIHIIDRAKLQLCGVLRDSQGAVTSIDIKDDYYLASCGLDRYLNVYNIKIKQRLFGINYLKRNQSIDPYIYEIDKSITDLLFE